MQSAWRRLSQRIGSRRLKYLKAAKAANINQRQSAVAISAASAWLSGVSMAYGVSAGIGNNQLAMACVAIIGGSLALGGSLRLSENGGESLAKWRLAKAGRREYGIMKGMAAACGGENVLKAHRRGGGSA